MGERYTPYSDISGDEAVTDGDDTVDAIGTHYLEMDGERIDYEALDSEQNSIRKALEDYFGEGFHKARKSRPAVASSSGRARGKSTDSAGRGAQGFTRREGKMCRAWAREQGFEVSDRGAIPKEAAAQWVAQGKPDAQNPPEFSRRDGGPATSDDLPADSESPADQPVDEDGAALEQDGSTPARDLEPV